MSDCPSGCHVNFDVTFILVTQSLYSRSIIMANSGHGFNPVVVNSVTYIGTLAAFFIALKVPGISIKKFPATGCLLVSNDAKQYLFSRFKHGFFDDISNFRDVSQP